MHGVMEDDLALLETLNEEPWPVVKSPSLGHALPERPHDYEHCVATRNRPYLHTANSAPQLSQHARALDRQSESQRHERRFEEFCPSSFPQHYHTK